MVLPLSMNKRCGSSIDSKRSQFHNETLVARAQAARFDFLQVPFDVLVQQQFFPSHGLAAFLHKWHQSEILTR
jgi:hypothetical protein